MSDQPLQRFRVPLTAVVLLAALANLAWEHFNGGVQSHHLLHRANLPAISNWWSVLLLPALTWFAVGRVQKRVTAGLPMSVVVGFVGALLYGGILAAAFTYDYPTVTSYMFQGMFLLALLLPVYRAECVLGFVLGMSITFGAVLPTVVACVVAAASAVIGFVVLPVLLRLWIWSRR
jgi:uncharacterized membrane protein YeaQ/YmgE (transglycosylase-associated protein family)